MRKICLTSSSASIAQTVHAPPLQEEAVWVWQSSRPLLQRMADISGLRANWEREQRLPLPCPWSKRQSNPHSPRTNLACKKPVHKKCVVVWCGVVPSTAHTTQLFFICIVIAVAAYTASEIVIGIVISIARAISKLEVVKDDRI